MQTVVYSDANFEFDTVEQVWQVGTVLLQRTTLFKQKELLYILDKECMFAVPSMEEGPFH